MFDIYDPFPIPKKTVAPHPQLENNIKIFKLLSFHREESGSGDSILRASRLVQRTSALPGHIPEVGMLDQREDLASGAQDIRSFPSYSVSEIPNPLKKPSIGLFNFLTAIGKHGK